MLIKRYRILEHGDESVLRLEEAPTPQPAAGQVLVRHTAVGVNFIDIYHRKGLYPLELPSGIGQEAAGIVEAVGPGVSRWKEGDRVGYCQGAMGAYAEANLVAADRLIALPDFVSDEQAAAVLLKGLTAAYLLHHTFPVKAGQTLLWHAAAGGVGLLACQWANKLGARVIGTVGSAEKAELAKARGCSEIILYREEPVAPRVRALTKGEGVPVVYDSVGKDTFAASLDSLAPRVARELWQCLRRSAGFQPLVAGPERLAVPDPSNPRSLRPYAGRAAGAGGAAVRSHQKRLAAGGHPPAISPQ